MTIEAGATAPDFSLTGLDSETYSLAEGLQRGPVLLVFFKTTCATCDLAFPYLNRLRDTYPGERWSLWTVAQDAPDDAADYASTFDITYPVLPDADGYSVSKAYDPPSTPTFFLIDADSRVVEETHGFAKEDLNRISREVAERLGEQPAVVAPAGDGNPDFKPG